MAMQHAKAVPTSPWQAIIAAPGPLQRMGVRVSSTGVAALDYLDAKIALQTASNPLARQAVTQLNAWFDDPRAVFDLPLDLNGTPFQRRVWAALQAIPAGETRSYGELARALSSSPRAIGGACRANPLPIIVPCHRVVAGSGMGGYSGATAGRMLAIKQWLLQHERG